MELQAKVIQILPQQTFISKNGEIVKNAFVVEWAENGYNQKLCLEVIGAERFEKMKKDVVVGNEVLVRFSVSSREYNGRFYTSTNCFYCTSIKQQIAQETQVQSSPIQNAQPFIEKTPNETQHDDVPF